MKKTSISQLNQGVHQSTLSGKDKVSHFHYHLNRPYSQPSNVWLVAFLSISVLFLYIYSHSLMVNDAEKDIVEALNNIQDAISKEKERDAISNASLYDIDRRLESIEKKIDDVKPSLSPLQKLLIFLGMSSIICGLIVFTNYCPSDNEDGSSLDSDDLT